MYRAIEVKRDTTRKLFGLTLGYNQIKQLYA